MATTTPHFHYSTTPQLSISGYPAEVQRKLSDTFAPAGLSEHSTRASSYESLDCSCDQQSTILPSNPQKQVRSARYVQKIQKQGTQNGYQSHWYNNQRNSLHIEGVSTQSYNKKAVHGQTYVQSSKPSYRAQANNCTEEETKYKTEMCKNLKETGACKFGSKCKFAHSEAEIRNKTHINLHYRSKKCSQFFELGYCPYGGRCQYLHTEDSYTEIFNSYCEKLLAWTVRNPQLDMTAIMRKTHPFVTGLDVFKSLYEDQV